MDWDSCNTNLVELHACNSTSIIGNLNELRKDHDSCSPTSTRAQIVHDAARLELTQDAESAVLENTGSLEKVGAPEYRAIKI